MLKDLGYDPLTARDGRDAIDVYLSRHPNCVLMDMRMPARDGLTAARRIREMERERSAEIPIFLAALTANVLPEERANCLDAGMDDYLSKPFKRRRLAEILAMASARVTGSVNQQDYKHNM